MRPCFEVHDLLFCCPGPPGLPPISPLKETIDKLHEGHGASWLVVYNEFKKSKTTTTPNGSQSSSAADAQKKPKRKKLRQPQIQRRAHAIKCGTRTNGTKALQVRVKHKPPNSTSPTKAQTKAAQWSLCALAPNRNRGRTLRTPRALGNKPLRRTRVCFPAPTFGAFVGRLRRLA